MSARENVVMNDEKMRKIKRVAIWGGLLFLLVSVINAVVKYEVGKMREDKSEEVGYRLTYGDLQYSDSIVINTSREEVYKAVKSISNNSIILQTK